MVQTLRVVVGALLGAVVVITLAMSFVLGTEDGAYEPTLLLAVPVVAGVLAVLLSETIGYRHPALPPGLAPQEAKRRSTTAYSAGTFLRFALGEAVLLLSLALAFVVTEGGFLVVLVAAMVSLVVVWFECWPRERPIARSQASLERDGGLSYLREAFGMRTDTVIQEL